VSVNRWLRRILKVKWPDKISKEELCQRTKETPTEKQRRKNGVGLVTDYVNHKEQ
jgi:hypothetical protein